MGAPVNLLQAFGLSTASGLNAYVPLLVAGLLARYSDLVHLNPPYDLLAHPGVLTVLALLAALDFLADKVPVVDHALQWLGQDAAKPFFCWMHLYDPHAPYAPPEPYKSRYAGRPYLGEIAFVDAQVGRVLSYLDAHSLLDRTIVEAYANGCACLTARIYPSREDSRGVALVVQGGDAVVRTIDIWELASDRATR